MKTKKTIGIIILIAVAILIITSLKSGTFFSVAPTCGDSVCNNGETYLTCSLDCAKCSNQICEYNKFPPENFSVCPTDCHQNNNFCDYGETCGNSADCACGSTQTCSNNQCVEITPPAPPTPSIWSQEIFKIGQVSITVTLLIIAIGIIIALSLLIGK